VRKIVIFSKYKKMTHIICRELAHIKPLHLNGDVDVKDRQQMIDDFQTKEENRVFVATLGAGGVGITLTAADLCIFYDAHWAPNLNTQAADRLHRIGQKNSVLIVSLRAKNTIDEHVARVWMEKQEMVAGMIGDEAVLGKLTKDELEKLI
jgi:SNF2 family DNA or RNA helicase